MDIVEVDTVDSMWGMHLGKQKVKIHKNHDCTSPCPFHSPSNHVMREWPMVIRFDKVALIERTCKHGVGHPDPDSVSYIGEWSGSHGCDGCCSE